MEGEPGGLQSMGVPKSLTTSKSRGTELNSVQEGLWMKTRLEPRTEP